MNKIILFFIAVLAVSICYAGEALANDKDSDVEIKSSNLLTRKTTVDKYVPTRSL